ncbi:MAG: DUF4832 domain-containing protein [Chitinophagaceae bacterium]
MLLKLNRIIALFIFSLALQTTFAQLSEISYQESNEDFSNPERGFYIPADAHSAKFVPLTAEKIISDRKELKKHGSASYAIYSTLLYRGYLLDSFVNKPISESFLENLDKDFSVVREAGVKVILRFAYTNKVHNDGCMDKEGICPPYGDAPKEIMLGHIRQLKPILQKNADVIAVMQEGFIGIWGENYYTDYFGDASNNGAGKIMDNNWNDRNEILKALLGALPKDRMIQVRTPQIKQKFVYGPKATTDSKASSEAEAFSFSDNSRIGFHNDCFLASVDDYGTFYDYGNSTTAKKPANEVLRSYFKSESRFGPVGGETCDDTFSPQNDCAPAGHAEEEMASMHYSFLNTVYNNKVNNDWDSLGCMESIKRKLGYRFVLKSTKLPAVNKAGAALHIALQLENVGYASPYNPRPVMIVLRNTENGKEYFLDSKADVRRWFTGKIVWDEIIGLPKDIVPGKYNLFVNLPDKAASLHGRPEYSIRFANENTWEEKSGYNNLLSAITITK